MEEEGWRLDFDGAANKCGNGIGVVVVSPDGARLPVAYKLGYEATNNEACILGLETALALGICEITVYGDSTLVIKKVLGLGKVKEERLVPYPRHLYALGQKFDSTTFLHIPRENKGMPGKLRSARLRTLKPLLLFFSLMEVGLE